MKAANQKMQAFLRRVTLDLRLGDSRRFQPPGAGLMRLTVERIGPNLVSLAHYGEQNGDLMCDPEIVFWRGPDEVYYPISFRNDYLGMDQTLVTFENGQPARIHARGQRDAATFCGTWVDNIRASDYEAHPVVDVQAVAS